MAYKINGTTVVDNSRNVCACCVTSCCITASTRLDAPSGTTANRPSSPATGSLYFDTDEGSLVSYNGTDWSAVGGAGFTPTEMTAVSDWIGPIFQCTCISAQSGTCVNISDTFFNFNPYTCQLMYGGLSCQNSRCGYVKYLTFTPSNCGVVFSCCSCLCCCGYCGLHQPPNASNCCGCVKRIWGNSTILYAHFKDRSVFPAYCNGCCQAYVMLCGTACDFCLCCVSYSQYCYGFCCGYPYSHCFNFLCCFCKMMVTDDRCCVSFLQSGAIGFSCCCGVTCNFTAPAWFRFNGPIPGATCCYDPIPLQGGDCKWTTMEFYGIHHFCNGLLYGLYKTGSVGCMAYMFVCNDGDAINIMMPCCDGSLRCWFQICEYTNYPTGYIHNGAFRLNSEYFATELYGQRTDPRFYYAIFKHDLGSVCFDALAQCVVLAKESVTLCCNQNGGMFCFKYCRPGCDSPRARDSGTGINYTEYFNNSARFLYCNNVLCTYAGSTVTTIGSRFYCECWAVTPHNRCLSPTCAVYCPATDVGDFPYTAYSAVKSYNPTDALYPDDTKYDKYPSDYRCFGAQGALTKYGCLCWYGTDTINTCDMQLYCVVCQNMTPSGDASKLHVYVSWICKQYRCTNNTCPICQCAFYVRLYCG